MNEKLKDLLELSFKIKICILIGVIALLPLAYYLIFYQEIGTQLSQEQEAVDRLDDEIQKKKVIAAHLPQFEQEVAKLDVELAKALKELPDKKEVDQLLARISDKARDSGLEINLFQPQTEQMKDFYAELPVQIEVTGNYHQVAAFFDEIAHLERIVNVDRFTISEPKVSDDEVLVKTSAIATSFRFLEENERPKDESGKRKKRAARRPSSSKAE